MSSGTSSTQGQPTLPSAPPSPGAASETLLRPDEIAPSAEMASKNSSPGAPLYVVLTGNPNCGKTTLFNALTGLRAKVGNYAGVTVERKEGRLISAPAGLNA